VRPPLPRLLALPLDLVLGTAGALLPSVGLPSLPVRLRVIRRDGAAVVLGTDGRFFGEGEEDGEDGSRSDGAGDREDGAEGDGGGGRFDGGGSADGEEVEEEEGIAAGEGAVGALETGTLMGV
jgi:hypothetical protein